MKSFLFILPSLKNTSPIKVAMLQANNLSSRGFVVSILVLDKTDSFFEVNHKIKLVGVLSLFKSYDYIHSHCLKPNILIGVLSFFGFFNSTLITTVHTDIYLDLMDKLPFGTQIISNVWRKAILRNNIILCLNEENRKVISRGDLIANDKIHIIPNGINEIITNNVKDRDFISFVSDSDSIILGAACVLRKVKRIDVILRILKQHSNLKFILVGDGPELNNLKKLIDYYKIENQVLLLGFKENPNDYISYVDIAVFPSLSEGFPLSLIEAMSLGIPCITSKIPAFEYFFKDEIERFTSIDEIYDLIMKIYSKRKTYSYKVREKYINEFTVDAIVDRYLLIIKKHQD